MPRFFIEVPHDAEVVACARVVESFLNYGSHFATQADWGCQDGEHKAWIVIEAEKKRKHVPFCRPHSSRGQRSSSSTNSTWRILLKSLRAIDIKPRRLRHSRPRRMEFMQNTNNLKEIPGVGDKLARILMDLGYRRVDDLRGENPEEMYHRLGALRQSHIDRCVLYVFRCAVYYAESSAPDAELLKWWNWKDKQ